MSPVQPAIVARIPRLCVALGLAAACATALAAGAPADTPAKPKTAKELLDASSPSEWRTPDPQDILYMQLPAGRVVIELAPRFAPQHVANIRALARGHYWDGLSIYRSQDNFVVQFGDPTEDEKQRKSIGTARAHLPAEFTRDAAGLPFDALPDSDGWAPEVGFSEGFPAARDPAAGRAWMAHCYGTLGAGRDVAAASSNGTARYVVDGQSPRAIRSRARPGWRTATARSARAATSPPIPATAPSSTSSTASRRAGWIATSPSSAACSRAWSC
jgi:peptidylprolyl isomerase